MFGIKKEILGAVKEAPRVLVDSIFNVITAPPAKAVEMWQGLPPEDKELFKQAAISGIRITARMIITADKGGKATF